MDLIGMLRVTCFFIIAAVPMTHDSIGADFKKEFISEYKTHLDAWDSKLSKVIATGQYEKKDAIVGSKTKTDSKKLEYYSNGMLERIDQIVESEDKDAKQANNIVIVSSPPGFFSVSRTGSDVPYRLDRFDSERMDGTFQFLFTRFAKTLFRSPVYAGVVSMRTIVDHKNIVIEKFSKTDDGKSARIDFLWPKSESERGFQGWISFSIDNNWSVQEYNYSSIKSSESYKGFIRFDLPKDGGERWPSETSMSIINAPAVSYITCKFSQFSTKATDNSMFSLERFGLEDFGSSPKNSISPIFWLFLLSGVFFIAGIILYRISHRSKPTK
jgi:hypothetical protein